MLHEVTTEFLRVAFRYDWVYKFVFMVDGEIIIPLIKCPTLFLITLGDLLRHMNERVVMLTPNSKGIVIDNPHGHFPRRDPEAFAGEVFSFIEHVHYLP